MSRKILTSNQMCRHMMQVDIKVPLLLFDVKEKLIVQKLIVQMFEMSMIRKNIREKEVDVCALPSPPPPLTSA